APSGRNRRHDDWRVVGIFDDGRELRRPPHVFVTHHVAGRLAVFRLAGKPEPHAAHVGEAEHRPRCPALRPLSARRRYCRRDARERVAVNHVTADDNWSRPERAGCLRMPSLPAKDFWSAKNTLTQRAASRESIPATEHNATGLKS